MEHAQISTKTVGSQSTRWMKCRPCRNEMVGTALVLDQVRSSHTCKNSTAECFLGPEVSLARTPNYSDIKTAICYHTLTIKNAVVTSTRHTIYHYKYKQYTNTTQLLILLRCISYIVSFNDMFRL